MRINTTAAVAVAALGLALGGLTACDDNETGSASESGGDSAGQQDSGGGTDDADEQQAPAGELTGVTMVKSGGYAGTEETLELKADGSWTYVKNKMAPQDGELSKKEKKSLSELAAGKEITEQGDTSSKDQCNDMQRYTLTLEFKDESKPLELKNGKCGEAPNDAFKDMIDLISEATPI